MTKVKVEKVPSSSDWRSTDAIEINRRRQRAQKENFKIKMPKGKSVVMGTF
jgi:hypothetical protein